MTTGNISSNEEDDLFNFDGLSLGAKTGAAASAVAAAPAAPIAPAAAHASTPLAHVASTAPAAALPTASSPVARPLPAQAAGTQSQAAGQLPLVMPVTAKPAIAQSFETAAQPQSALARSYQLRFGGGISRVRKIGIVAVARKLLIAFWRSLETNTMAEGAMLRA